MKLRHTLFISLCATLPLFACQTLDEQANSTKKEDLSMNSNERSLHVGEEFTISLKSNPTTGYNWQVVKPFATNLLEQVKNSYESDQNSMQMVGVGGTEVWTFKALKAGKTVLRFEYSRPWEKTVPAVQSAEYTIHISQ